MGAPLQVLANGTFDELISGSMAFGVLTVSGTNSFGAVSLDGTLDITLLNTFLPEIGQSFTILRFTPNTLTGTFSNIEGQTFNNETEMWMSSTTTQEGKWTWSRHQTWFRSLRCLCWWAWDFLALCAPVSGTEPHRAVLRQTWIVKPSVPCGPYE